MKISFMTVDQFGQMDFYPAGMEDDSDEIIKELSEMLESEGMEKINPILFTEQNKWFEKTREYYPVKHYAKCMWVYEDLFAVAYTKRFTLFRANKVPVKNMTPEQHQKWEESLNFMNDLYVFFWKTYYQSEEFNAT